MSTVVSNFMFECESISLAICPGSEWIWVQKEFDQDSSVKDVGLNTKQLLQTQS